MKNVKKRIGAGISILMIAAMMAGCGNGDKIGTVDMNQVMEKAPAAQKIKKQIEAKQAAQEKDLQQAKVTLSPAAYQQQEQKIQQNMQAYSMSMQQQFQSQMEGKLAEIAKEKKVGIIVYKEAVPQGGIDVTADVIAKLK